MKPTVTSQKAPLGILGEHLIDEAAVQQMKRAMELPVSIAGYLLPDAHVGYGIPIGGVWATRNAISPYAVGVDIGCRMQVTVFDAKEDAIPVKELRRAVQQHTVFGAGQTFRAGDRNSDPVLDSPEWTRHPWLKQNPKLLDTARDQLGTSGGGNHFINFGRVELPDGSEHLGMMTHSGSRGFGASVARHYSKLAQKLHPELPKDVIHLAWFELDSEEGQQYWRAMQLAGQYAAANHNVIHRRLSEHLGLEALDVISNFHNFAWLEDVQLKGRKPVEAVVHRKGATPAGKGVRGVIPGSMGTPAYLVSGKGNPVSLQSASHGSGRVLSRRQAKREFRGRDLRAEMRGRGVELIGGDLDEHPEVYKPIAEIMSLQEHLVDVIGVFHPKFVRMAHD